MGVRKKESEKEKKRGREGKEKKRERGKRKKRVRGKRKGNNNDLLVTDALLILHHIIAVILI